MSTKMFVIFKKMHKGRTTRNILVICKAPFVFSNALEMKVFSDEKLPLYRTLLLWLTREYADFWDRFIDYNNPALRRGSNIHRVYVSRNRSDIRGRPEEIVPGIFIETIFGASADFFAQACASVDVPIRMLPPELEAAFVAVKQAAHR